jgi:hypothetical protein
LAARLRRTQRGGGSGPQTPASSLAERIEALDTSLFEALPSQTTENDRGSLLALHLAARERYGPFAYLEIGSHLGGSLQVLIADPACTSITSIDARPQVQPDERGFDYRYPENSTAAMRSLLADVPDADLSKLDTHDADAADVPIEALRERPRLCLIDAEHTDEAVVRDADYCLRALDPAGGLIIFHDVGVVYRGIRTWLDQRFEAGQEWLTPFALPDTLFAIEVGEVTLRDDPRIRARIDRQWEGVLWMLESNDRYREFFRSRRVRLMRRLGLAPPIDET